MKGIQILQRLFVCCAAAWLMVACSSSPGLGDACESAGDPCEEGLQCIAKATGTRECMPRLSPGDGGICEANDDCAKDAECHAGQCRWLVEGLPCDGDSDCGGENVCRQVDDHRQCAARAAACEPCDTDSDCADETICKGGICLQSLGGECRSDACCGGGQLCYPANKNAMTPSEAMICAYPQNEAQAYCGIEAHCAEGRSCIGSECRIEQNGPCAELDDCVPGLACTDGLCVPPAPQP